MSLMMASSAAALVMALQTAPQVHYQLSIEEGADTRPVVTVELRFDGETDGSTDLYLPDNWGGESELWNGIESLVVEGADVSQGDDARVRVLTHAPGAALTVRYQLVQDWQGVPNAEQSNYRPILQPGFLHLIGNTWIAEPDLGSDKTVTMDLQAPEGWTLASDMQHGVSTMDDIMSSVLVAGDYQVFTTELDGAAIRTGIRGEGWPMSEQAFADEVTRVVAASHAYWNTPAEPYFVSIMPVDAPENWQSLGGTNLGDSFAFFATRNLDPSMLTEILTHEHTHTWMPLRLGGLIDGDEQPSEYWLSEGFTEFLTQRVGVNGGLWTAEESIASWNGALQEYWTSPVNDQPNSAITTGFWAERDYQRLPYLRGMMFAARAEALIREATQGQRDLDDVFQHMLNVEEGVTAPQAFLPAVQAVAGIDLSAEVEHYINQGNLVDIPDDAFGACGEVVTLDQPVFEYGLTWGDPLEDGRRPLEAVEPGTNAERAGFLPGMFLIERVGGAYGDASQESVFRVEHEGEIREIGYLPSNGETFPLQQIIVADDVDWQACRRVLAGR